MKVIDYDDINLTVYPVTGYQYYNKCKDLEELEERANRVRSVARALENDIKRHVDDVLSIHINYPCICSFCRNTWEEEISGINKGFPMCCDAAQEEFSKMHNRQYVI